MGIIRRLSASVINQIAAGEVVERPASVVKELLENAIDATALRIDVAVERGGKDLVRVADDGSGIGREDLPTAFEPHATSKLETAEELARIRTLGFRGEALAAIAEVSKTRCQSRPSDSAAGAEITIEGGVATSVREVGCPPGTVIEVRNLFFNTPVRRSFLKSDSTEAGHVTETFARVALAHPTVRFSFRSGGKLLHDLPAVTGLRDRIAVFHGRELADSLLWVESEFGPYHLWGYVGHPSQSRPSNKGQYLFICGRYVRDRSLSHALSEAYRGLLMVGRMPVAYLCLEVPPEEVDVNVHPTKIEVRFRDSHTIYSRMLAAIRQTFLQSDLHSRLQVPVHTGKNAEQSSSDLASPATHVQGGAAATGFQLAGDGSSRQTVNDWFQGDREPSADRPLAPLPDPSRWANPPLPEWAKSLPPAALPTTGEAFDEIGSAKSKNGETLLPFDPIDGAAPRPPFAGMPFVEQRLIEPDPHPHARAIQLHDSYLVAETSEGMVVIDQHALHERILFEELRDRLNRGGVESQRLLVPEPVELSASDAAEVIERSEALARLGFEIEPFGGDTVVIRSIPALFANVSPERLLRDLVELFRSKPLPPTRDAVLEQILSTIACKAAVKAGQRLSDAEIEALLAQRHLASDTHHCPHGRPTALTFTKSELERQFGRI